MAILVSFTAGKIISVIAFSVDLFDGRSLFIVFAFIFIKRIKSAYPISRCVHGAKSGLQIGARSNGIDSFASREKDWHGCSDTNMRHIKLAKQT